MYLPRLRQWREAQGETQGQLGERAGVALHTVHRIESGLPTTPPTARKLADALGVSVADLIEEPPVPLGGASEARRLGHKPGTTGQRESKDMWTQIVADSVAHISEVLAEYGEVTLRVSDDGEEVVLSTRENSRD